MAFRPTISVCIDGEPVDWGYYRNWHCKDLFFEAIAIAALYGDCRSKEEYMQRRYGCRRVCYVLEPETFEDTAENLSMLIEVSEYPIMVDLSARCIYQSYKVLSGAELLRRPLVGEEPAPEWRHRALPYVDPDADFEFLLDRYRISFGGIDLAAVREILRSWPQAGEHLSGDMFKALRRAG